MTETSDWYGPEAATFGDRVAAAREASKMDQEQLAQRLGVKLKTLQAWENDQSEPRANRLQMLAGLLNVPLVWLMTGTGPGVEPPEDLAAPLPDSLNDALLELRALRLQVASAGERLGLLEKTLRKHLKDTA